MTKENKKLLELFQCDFNRSIEENFAQIMTENDAVRLFFINENEAFTDGQNIVVDPACDELFADVIALKNTECFMKLDSVISSDPWYALRMIARSQNIHESLHIIYTDFPLKVKNDSRATTKARAKTLALISNIIEDAFIEAVGCSVYDNLELYLTFGRVSRLFANTPSDGTVNKAFQDELSDENAKNTLPLTEYLDYMAVFLLYPMIDQQPPRAAIRAYVEATKELFFEGSLCGNPQERFHFSQRIFDIIEPLIPDSDVLIDEKVLEKMLGGLKTHSADDATIGRPVSQGKNDVALRRLFTDTNGNPIDKNKLNDELIKILPQYQSDKAAAIKIVTAQATLTEWNSDQFDCTQIHKGIKILEEKPKVNLNLRKAYQNILQKYHLSINSYNSRFEQLLKAMMPVKEDGYLFGTGIASNKLGDVKKRYWYKNSLGQEVPDIAILFLIDGSGSMKGDRCESAMISAVVLHEVLKKQGVKHAIVEHRAIYDEPIVKHKLLVDFNAHEEDQYNILSLKAEEGTREGLSLYWAEKYIHTKASADKYLIIVLSDGVPAHGLDGDACYIPPVSIQDTANVVKKITKRGTSIIAVALDDGNDDSCYQALKKIYPSVVACSDLKHLTGQLLRLISKQFV